MTRIISYGSETRKKHKKPEEGAGREENSVNSFMLSLRNLKNTLVGMHWRSSLNLGYKLPTSRKDSQEEQELPAGIRLLKGSED